MARTHNPETDRWGGPGSSHEDAKTPTPEKPARSGRASDEPTNTPFSHVSGGGGERDRHHGEDAKAKHIKQENAAQKAKP